MKSLKSLWMKVEGLGKAGLAFRLLSNIYGISLIYLHHQVDGQGLNWATWLELLLIPLLSIGMFFHYAYHGSDRGLLLKQNTYDLFIVGVYAGLMQLSAVPSAVFILAIISNYLGVRGAGKLYRLLLIPIGVSVGLLCTGFTISYEASNLLVGLSVLYAGIHLTVLALISYHFTKQANNVNKILVKKNKEIDQQKEEIMLQSQEIITINETLNELNGHLEEKVSQRTSELAAKNDKLADYAFVNAHLLRRPVANILGLVHLFEQDVLDDGDIKEVIDRIKTSTEELDKTVREIRNRLEEEDLINVQNN